MLVRLVREVAAIAKAAGVTLMNEDTLLPLQGILSGSEEAAVQAVLQAGRDFQRNAPNHRMSSLQDLEAGRPLEIEETLGYAVRRARQLQQPVPLLDSLYHLAVAIDRTRGASASRCRSALAIPPVQCCDDRPFKDPREALWKPAEPRSRRIRFSCRCAIRHPSIDPASISRELQIEPEHSFRAGEPRESARSLAVTPVHVESYWLATLDLSTLLLGTALAPDDQPAHARNRFLRARHCADRPDQQRAAPACASSFTACSPKAARCG